MNCLTVDCQGGWPGCTGLGGPPSGGVLGWQFSDLLTESLPPGAPSPLSFDSTTAFCGNSSGKITWEHRNPLTGQLLPHAPIFFNQVVHVFPYRKYTLSGWMQTQNVRYCAGCDFGVGSTPGQYAYYAVQLIRTSPFENPTLATFPKVSGTQAWFHQSQTFFVPQGVHYINIECVLSGSGTVWFDGVSLRDDSYRLNPGT